LWQARVAAQQRDAAREEAMRATALNDFMEQILAGSDPEAQGGAREVKVIDLLDQASERVGRTLAGQPEAEAEARGVLGKTFISLAEFDKGVAELERAVALREKGPGRDSVSQATSLQMLARAHRDAGDFDRALSLYQRAAAIVDAKGDEALGERAKAHYLIGRTLGQASRFPEGEQELDRATELLDRMPDDELATRALVLSERADFARFWTNDAASAERLSTEALDLARRNGEPFLIADALGNLAVIKNYAGKLDEAIAIYEEAIPLTREVYGERHPHVAVRLENLGDVYRMQGKFAQTDALLDEVLAIREEAWGADSPAVARTRVNRGVVALQQNDFARASQLIGSGLDSIRTQSGGQSLDYALVVFALGKAEAGLGDRAKALGRFEESLAIQDAVGTSPTDEMRLRTLHSMADLHCAMRSREETRRTVETAVAALDQAAQGRGDADHQRWIETFEKLRARCGV
jgi:tetratricopeptide (TPR) repeat protein